MPVAWIVSGSPVGGGARVAPQAAVVVEHARLDEQRLRERERAPGIAGQQHALGERRGRVQVDAARGALSGTAADFRLRAHGNARRLARLSGRAGGDPVDEPGELTLAQVAARAGVSPATVRRWVQMGLVPGYEGAGRRAAAAYVRVVARLRARGHTLEQIKRASDSGQLAVGPIENLLSGSEGALHAARGRARRRGLDGRADRAHPTPRWASARCRSTRSPTRTSRSCATPPTVLDAGLPPAAFLQLLRVYGQAIAQIADAEVRLVHLYVHEPLMREGVAERGDRARRWRA